MQHRAVMDRNNVYIQFPSWQEAIFTIQHGIRPKFELERIDKLSNIISFCIVLIRFSIDTIQMIFLSSLRTDYLSCENWLSCALSYVSLPLNNIANVSAGAHFGIQLALLLLCLSIFILMTFCAFTVRKRDINLSRIRFGVIAFTYGVLFYFPDIIMLGVRSFFCHFHTAHYAISAPIDCQDGFFYANFVTGVVLLICVIPLSFVLCAFSPLFDFRRLSGKVTSTRLDLWSFVMKIIVCFCVGGVHNAEQSSNITSDSLYDIKFNVRIGIFGVFMVGFGILLFAHIILVPHIRSFDNRLRACSLGCIFGILIVCFINSIIGISDGVVTENSGLGRDYSLSKAVAGAIVGCLAAGCALFRKRRLGYLLQRDINQLTSQFDFHLYSDGLQKILSSSSDEDLDELCGSNIVNFDNLAQQALASVSNGLKIEKINDDLLHNDNNNMFFQNGSSSPGGLTNGNDGLNSPTSAWSNGINNNHHNSNQNGFNNNFFTKGNSNQVVDMSTLQENSATKLRNGVATASQAVNFYKNTNNNNANNYNQSVYSNTSIHTNLNTHNNNANNNANNNGISPLVGPKTNQSVFKFNDKSENYVQNSNANIYTPQNNNFKNDEFNYSKNNQHNPVSINLLPLTSNQKNPSSPASYKQLQPQNSQTQQQQQNQIMILNENNTAIVEKIPETASQDSAFILAAVELRQSRSRLNSYLQSQSFNELSKQFNFENDLELTLRTITEEWQHLANFQRATVKCAVLQLMAALYLKTSRGQDGSICSSYFLWFSGVCLTLFRDVDMAQNGIRIASECEGDSMKLEPAFLCYLLQKACEDIKTSSHLSKRASGISDMAAFRRWTTSARSIHEKALTALKRFFKMSSSASYLSKISSFESDRAVSSTDLKTVHDSRTQLHDALRLLRNAESAYDNLLLRYPSVPQVMMMTTMFKRQFFREMESAKYDVNVNNTDINTNGGALNTSGGNQAVANNNNVVDSNDNDGTLSVSASHTSLGSGLGETPKQVRLQHLSDAVFRTFGKIRLWTFTALFVVVCISTCLLVVAILELRTVENWMSVFEVIGNVFDVIPRSCATVSRPAMGSRLFGTQFFDPVQTYITTTVDLIDTLQTDGATGRSLTNDNQACVDLLTALNVTTDCYIAYTDGQGSFVHYDSTLGVFSDVSTDYTGYELLAANADDQTQYAFWTRILAKIASTDSITSGSFLNIFTTDNLYAGTMQKFTVAPFFFAPPGSVGHNALNPPFQGVLAVSAPPTENDQYVVEFAGRLDDLSTSMNEKANEVSTSAMNMKITKLIDVLSNTSFFSTSTFYSDGVTRFARTFTFVEGVTYLSSGILKIHDDFFNTWDYKYILYTSYFMDVIEFCSSNNIRVSVDILDAFKDHLYATVSNSRFIITICAVGAVIAALIGASLTTYLIRRFLKEFDRSDGVTPALAMIATFPKAELRRIARSIQFLRPDRGVFDPDDERAAHLDLTVNRKTQKYQDALLKASLLMVKRDVELAKEINFDQGGDASGIQGMYLKEMDFDEHQGDGGAQVDTLEEDLFKDDDIHVQNFSNKPVRKVQHQQREDDIFTPTIIKKNGFNNYQQNDLNAYQQQQQQVLRFSSQQQNFNSSTFNYNNVTRNDERHYQQDRNSFSSGNPHRLSPPSVKHHRVDSNNSYSAKGTENKSFKKANNSNSPKKPKETMNRSNVDSFMKTEPSLMDSSDESHFYQEQQQKQQKKGSENSAAIVFENNANYVIKNQNSTSPMTRNGMRGDRSFVDSEDDDRANFDKSIDGGGAGLLDDDEGNEDFIHENLDRQSFNSGRSNEKNDDNVFFHTEDLQNETSVRTKKTPAVSSTKKTTKFAATSATTPLRDVLHSVAQQSPTASPNGKVTSSHHHLGGVNGMAIDDEVATIGSTVKTTSSASMQSMPHRVKNAIIRRPVTRAFVVIWAVIMTYVASSLVVCIISVGRYTFFYSRTSDLMLSSFDLACVTLLSTFVQRGKLWYMTSTHDEFNEWAAEHLTSAKSGFFDTVDGPSEKSGTTLGRAYPRGELLLYNSVCLPELLSPDVTGYQSCTNRSKFNTYPKQSQMEAGLVRAILTFNDAMKLNLELYKDSVSSVLYASDTDTWFLYDSLGNDIEPGMIALRDVIRDKALDQVDRDTSTQIILMAGGIFVAVVMGVLMEFVIRLQIISFNDSLLLLRLLPTRLSDDYRIVEKVMNIADRDDELDIMAAPVSGSPAQAVYDNGKSSSSRKKT